jgi:hypothetical protein
MPLSDAMKGAFGPEAAATFEHAANSNIQKSLETVRAAKDSINNAILQVEGKIPPQTDMAQPAATPPPNDMAVAGDDVTNGDNRGTSEATDTFAGADAASGPDAEPLGRARKESRSNSKSVIEGKTIRRNPDDDDEVVDRKKKLKKDKEPKKIDEALNFNQVGERILKSVSMDKLTNWLLNEAAKKMQGSQFVRFTKSVTTKALNNPTWLAGYIAEKRWGTTKLRSLSESEKEVSRAEQIARGIATVIETNISLFGKGKAAQVVESLTNDLMENENSDVLEAFEKVYHSSPAMYSLRLARQIREIDANTTPNGGASAPLDPEDKENVSSGISQIASKLVADPSLASQPVAGAISNLDPDSQTALQKIAGDTSAGNIQNVGQLIKTADDKIDDKTPGGMNENHRRAKKLSGTKVKKVLVKEELIALGESKIHHREKHHHPSYLMGVGGYFAGLPREAFVGGYAGCDPGHGCKGFDEAKDHDVSGGVGASPAPLADAASPMGESVAVKSKKKKQMISE